MSEVIFNLTDAGEGIFEIKAQEKRIAEMVIAVSEKELTVYHTEVSPEAEGKGLAKMLLGEMVDYARKHQLKVIPLCPYVHAQFKRHPADYKDVWKTHGVE